MASIRNDSFVRRLFDDIAPDLRTLPTWAWEKVVLPQVQNAIYAIGVGLISSAMRRPVNAGMSTPLARRPGFPQSGQNAFGQPSSVAQPQNNIMPQGLKPIQYKDVVFADKIEADTVLLELRETAKASPRQEVSVGEYYAKAKIGEKFDTSCYNWFWSADELAQADMRYSADGYYLNIGRPRSKRQY